MLKQRIITGSILLATIWLAIVYLPATALLTLIGLILLLAAYELTALLGIKGTYSRFLYFVLLAAVTLFAGNLLDRGIEVGATDADWDMIRSIQYFRNEIFILFYKDLFL